MKRKLTHKKFLLSLSVIALLALIAMGIFTANKVQENQDYLSQKEK